MRWVAAALTAGLSIAATPATAATDSLLARQALFGAAFAAPSAIDGAGLAVGDDGRTQSRYLPGRGLLRESTGDLVSFGPADAAFVDSIRLTTVGFDPRPGAALLRPDAAGGANGLTYDLTFIRNWPQALSLDTGRLTFDVTPHAGFGLSADGVRTAEAGALVRLQNKVLQAVGMAGPGGGRLYLFAGASRRTGPVDPAHYLGAMSPNPEDGFVNETQAGLGFEHGLMQASFGVSHQSIQLNAMTDQGRTDNRIGLKISIR
jgi:hypothetical protein